MTRRPLLAVLAAVFIAAPYAASQSGSDHKHGKGHDHKAHKHDDATHGPKHGGQLFETDDHHGVEMVLNGTALVFHMTEDHDPLEVTGSSFKAIIQAAGGTKIVELKAEGTTLSATLDAPLAKGAKIAVSGKDPHGEVIQARFVAE